MDDSIPHRRRGLDAGRSYPAAVLDSAPPGCIVLIAGVFVVDVGDGVLHYRRFSDSRPVLVARTNRHGSNDSLRSCRCSHNSLGLSPTTFEFSAVVGL